MSTSLLHFSEIKARLSFLFLLIALSSQVFSQEVHVSPSGNDANDGSAGSPYKTIARAISVASAGTTINVSSGIYAERIIVNKQLTINGPNAGKEGKDGSRTAEAKIIPPTTDLSSATPMPLVKFVTGSAGSVFDGFEVNGDNPDLPASGIIAGGIDVDAAFGVLIDNEGGITIQNNLVQNYGSSAVAPYPYANGILAQNSGAGISSGIIITRNYIKNLNQASNLADLNAVMLFTNVYAQVTHNKMDNVRLGVQLVNYANANPGAAALIQDNDISSYRAGIYYNLQKVNASPWIIGNNTLQSITSPAGNAIYEGIRIESISGTVSTTITGNTIIGNDAQRFSENSAFKVWGMGFKGAVTTMGSLIVKDNDISKVQHGIVYTANGTAVTSKMKFRGGNIHDVSGDYIHYENAGGTPAYADIDLPTTKLEGKTGKEYTTSELADLKSSKITDKDDNSLFGLVQFIFPAKNITRETYFANIQEAIDDAGTVAGDVIELEAGIYKELVVVHKGVTIRGESGKIVTVTYDQAAGTGITPALFKVTAKNVTIENIGFEVDLTKTPSAIITSADASGLKVLNNRITATVAGNGTYAYGLRNAINVNLNIGMTGVTTIETGFGSPVFTGNVIKGINGAAFRSGIAVDACGFIAGGTDAGEGNTIETINHDIVGRFTSVGDITIQHNTLHGGGIQLTEFNAGLTAIRVEDNIFDYSALTVDNFALLRLQNNKNNIPTLIKNNQFKNHNWYISLENYQNATVDGNTFTPAIKNYSATSQFRHITVNTKTLVKSADTKIPVSATFVGNTFNGYTDVAAGKAIAFYNHDSNGALYGDFKIGDPGKENIFNNGIKNYIYLDGQTNANANGIAGFPEYDESSNATPASPWTKNIMAPDNKFDIGSGPVLASTMSATDRKLVKTNYITDKDDNPGVGEVFLHLPVQNVNTNVKYPTIQAAIDAANAGDVLLASAGDYAERVIVNKQLTINGPNAGKEGKDGSRTAEAKIIPPTTDLSSATPMPLVKFITGSAGSIFDGFEVNGDNPVLPASGIITDGVDVDAAFGILIENEGNITVQNNLVQNYGSSTTAPYPYANGILAQNNGATISSGIIITRNYIKNLNQASSLADLNAVMLFTNVYAQVTHNKMDEVRIGVQLGNNTKPDPNAATFSSLVENNDISSYRAGIYYNAHKINASKWTIGNNILQSIKSPVGNTIYEGIRIETIIGTVEATISGNTIIGNNDARIAENPNFEVWGLGFKNGVNTTGAFIVKDNDISKVKHGIVYTNDNATTALTTKVKFTGGNIHDVSGDYVRYQLSSGTPVYADINLPTTQLDGKTGKEYTAADLLSLKSTKITDKDDNAIFGLVRFIFPVKNITRDRYFATIQEAIDDAETQNGDVIDVEAGTYTLTTGINVTKELTIQGNSLNLTDKPLINGVGDVTNKALFYVTAPNVTIQNFHLQFEEENANSGTAKTSYGIRGGVNGTYNNLKVLDNLIEGTNPVYVFNSFGIFGGAQTNPSKVTDKITIQRNTVKHTVEANALGRAIRTWYTYGTIGGSEEDKNILNGHYASIQSNVPGKGDMIISFNVMQGKVEMNGLDPGTHKVTHNTISTGGNADALGSTGADRQPALVEVISSNKPFASLEISDNKLNDFKYYGVVVFASGNVSVLKNTFNPLAGETGFAHVYLDTKSPNGSEGGPDSLKNIIVKGNMFNASAPGVTGGKGLVFANSNGGDGTRTPLTGMVIGGAGTEANTFSAGLTEYISLSNTSGLSDGIAPWNTAFYGGTTATTAYPFNSNIVASENNFGGITPTTNGELYALETKINHGVDNGLTGFVTTKAKTAFPATAAETQNAFTVVPDENYTVLVKAGTNLSLATLTATKDITLGAEDPTISLAGITINGAGKTLTLDKPVNLSGAMTLTAGVVATSTTNMLSLTQSATFSIPVVDAYIDGPVSKILVQTERIEFPVGKDGFSAPIDVHSMYAGNNSVTVEYFRTANSNLTYVSPLVGVSQREYWKVDADGDGQIALTSFNHITSGVSDLNNTRVVFFDLDTDPWEIKGSAQIQDELLGLSRKFWGQGYLPLSGSYTLGTLNTQPMSDANISSVEVPENGTYKAGDVLDFKVNFSTPVTVSGTPAIDLTIGSSNQSADYVSSDGTTLLFKYTVQAGDLDINGIVLGTLQLNSGTIMAGSTTPDLTLNNIEPAIGVLVDGVPPVISNVTISSTSLKVGSMVSATITTDTDVDTYTLNNGSTIGGFALTNLIKVSNTSYTTVFTVAEGGADASSIPVNLVLNDAAGNPSVAYTTAFTGVVDAHTPVITSVDLPGDKVYTKGEPLDFKVNYSENITVTGASFIGLNIDGSIKTAAYISGSGTDLLLFRYTVQTGDLDADGITVNPAISGGTISDLAGNIAMNSLSLGSASGIQVDATAPKVSSVNVPLANIYKEGETLSFTVNFNEALTITGTDAHLNLTIGNTPVIATYLSATGGNVTFNYIVKAGELDTDGITVNSISLNSTTITDAAANQANTILINIDPTAGVKVDAVGPVITASQTFALDENSPAATVVGTVIATDAAAAGPLQNWAISAGNTNNAFAIDAATGVITVNTAVLDYETTNSYTLTLTVSDGSNTSVPENLTIAVNNLNDVNPVITALQTFSVDENVASGTTVGNILATDGDAGTTTFGNWTITGGNTANAFAIDASTGAITVSNAVLDRETTNNYTLTLTVSDGSNTSATENVIITVNDLNDVNPVITASQIFSVDENATSGTTVGNILATDGDLGTTFQNWTIAGGNSANAFAVDAATGAITVNSAALDYETTNSYTLTLTVSDGSNVSAPQTIMVNLNDRPEGLTRIDMIAAVFYENTPSGALAGTLSSTSEDLPASFTYTLVPGAGSADNSLFVISGNEIRTNALLNYEDKQTYRIRVRSTMQNNLFLDKELSIDLRDVNEQPTLDDIEGQAICYTQEVQTLNLAGLTAGPDAAQSVALSVSADNNALFESLDVTQTTGGNARLTYKIRNGASGTAVVNVKVSDDGGTANGGLDALIKSFTISVNPLPVVAISSDKGGVLSKGETAVLTASGTGTFQWENANGIVSGRNAATLTVRPSETTTYKVTVTNASGCSGAQEITITVKADYKLLAGTNILTPNGDGINDKFEIRNLDMYPGNELKIFDRAGRIMYSQKNYDGQWDGTLNGAALAENTYYYMVDFGPGINKIKGFITILRN